MRRLARLPAQIIHRTGPDQRHLHRADVLGVEENSLSRIVTCAGDSNSFDQRTRCVEEFDLAAVLFDIEQDDVVNRRGLVKVKTDDAAASIVIRVTAVIVFRDDQDVATTVVFEIMVTACRMVAVKDHCSVCAGVAIAGCSDRHAGNLRINDVTLVETFEVKLQEIFWAGLTILAQLNLVDPRIFAAVFATLDLDLVTRVQNQILNRRHRKRAAAASPAASVGVLVQLDAIDERPVDKDVDETLAIVFVEIAEVQVIGSCRAIEVGGRKPLVVRQLDVLATRCGIAMLNLVAVQMHVFGFDDDAVPRRWRGFVNILDLDPQRFDVVTAFPVRDLDGHVVGVVVATRLRVLIVGRSDKGQLARTGINFKEIFVATADDLVRHGIAIRVIRVDVDHERSVLVYAENAVLGQVREGRRRVRWCSVTCGKAVVIDPVAFDVARM